MPDVISARNNKVRLIQHPAEQAIDRLWLTPFGGTPLAG